MKKLVVVVVVAALGCGAPAQAAPFVYVTNFAGPVSQYDTGTGWAARTAVAAHGLDRAGGAARDSDQP